VPSSVFHGVQDLVEHWVRRAPDVCAVRDPATARELSYAQLWRRSGRLAVELTEAGVLPGEVVGIALGRSVDLVVAMLGIVRAGAVYLPLDDHAPTQRQADMLRDSAARAVVFPADAAFAAGWSRGVLPDGARAVAAPQQDPTGEEPPLPAGGGGDDPVYVMYTSGSTGRPKGVVVPHRAVIRLVVEPNYCTSRPGDRFANGSNPAFDASTFEVWGAMAAGATVVVFPAITEVGIEDWEVLVRRERITMMFLTTSLFHTVARERPDAFGSLDSLIVGGEQLEPTAVRRVLEAGPPGRLLNGYGPTETTTFAAYYECTPDSIAGRERIPIGFPLQNTGLHVLDGESRPVPVGATGELCISGPGVALGYQNRPDLTAQRFVAHAGHGVVYRTGDLARQQPDGAFEVLGRSDRQVKLRGFRIELEEVERALTATGLVDAAFVEKVGEGPSAVLVGFVLPASGAVSGSAAGDDPAGEPNGGLPGELSRQLGRQLPSYMVPGRWLVLDRVPLGPTGKTDRSRLVAFLDAPVRGDGATAAAQPAASRDIRPVGGPDSVGEELRALWRDVLGIRSVSDQDGFIELGGNSITAVQLVTRIEQQFAVQVEPAEILLAGSLSELTGHLHALIGDDAVSAAR
jgi:amino acid adenylation domain-containing protein